MRFTTALNGLVEDRSTSVRSCVVKALHGIAVSNPVLAFELFELLVRDHPDVIGTGYAEQFLRGGIVDHFDSVRRYIETLLHSPDEHACNLGVRLACLALLNGRPADDLVEEAVNGSVPMRKGVAIIASSNIALSECRAWCEPLLHRFFNDESRDVRTEAAKCFHHLGGEPLSQYEELIQVFCSSLGYADTSYGVLNALEESSQQLPNVTLMVCETFLSRFGSEATDISTSRAGDVHTISNLIFRTYQQHTGDDTASKCLDLIDTMYLEGINDVRGNMVEFER